jgi:hypothetical protein
MAKTEILQPQNPYLVYFYNLWTQRNCIGDIKAFNNSHSLSSGHFGNGNSYFSVIIYIFLFSLPVDMVNVALVKCVISMNLEYH